MSSKCVKYEKFCIIPPFSDVYSNCQLKIMQSSYRHLKYIPDNYNMSIQKQAPFTVIPLAMIRHRTGGGICNTGACAGFHIHIRDTSPHRDVSYLEFVFSSCV